MNQSVNVSSNVGDPRGADGRADAIHEQVANNGTLRGATAGGVCKKCGLDTGARGWRWIVQH